MNGDGEWTNGLFVCVWWCSWCGIVGYECFGVQNVGQKACEWKLSVRAKKGSLSFRRLIWWKITSEIVSMCAFAPSALHQMAWNEKKIISARIKITFRWRETGKKSDG